MDEAPDFFALNYKVLTWSGLWIPDRKSPHYYKHIMYNTICIMYSIVFFTIAEILQLADSSKNLSDLIKNLNMSLSFLLTSLKVTIWFYYHKEIVEIINILNKTSTTFHKVAGFDAADIVHEENKTSNKITWSFFTLCCLVPSLSCVVSFGNLVSAETCADEENNKYVCQKLPYYSWIPFDYKSSKIVFGVAVVHQCLALFSCGIITAGKLTIKTNCIKNSLRNWFIKLTVEVFSTLVFFCEFVLNINKQNVQQFNMQGTKIILTFK